MEVWKMENRLVVVAFVVVELDAVSPPLNAIWVEVAFEGKR